MYGCREGPRDRVAVEGDVVRYLLWGNEIANWNRAKGTLMVDDCGWKTKLTMDRLNAILWRLDFHVYRERWSFYIRDGRRDADYVWEGSHVIDLETRRITPSTSRRFNWKVSRGLSEWYERARKLVEKKPFLATRTLDGAVYIFVNQWYKRISRRVLGLHIRNNGFEAYYGMVAASRVYSAFMKGDASTVMRSLMQGGYRIDKAVEVLEKLRDFGVDLNVLPEKVVSQLALAKLVEG